MEIVNLTLIYFQDYRLAFLVINIFVDFLLHKNDDYVTEEV